MKLCAALFAFFAFTMPVTSIPLDSIDDGYVNIRSVTAKRLNEQNVDKRQLSDEMFNIVIAIGVYSDQYNYYHGYSRSDFTTNIVQALHNNNPHFNYIICHSDHDYDFGSPWGVNVYNVWVAYAHHAGFGKDPGYDVVVGKNGTFTRHGDGGFINWAYNGYVTNTSENHGTVVTFGIPG